MFWEITSSGAMERYVTANGSKLHVELTSTLCAIEENTRQLRQRRVVVGPWFKTGKKLT